MSSLLTGLQGYWKLDESSGNAADSSGNGRTLTNTGTTPYGAAKINNGAYFNGADNRRLSFSGSVNWSVGSAYSWSFWFLVNALFDFTIFDHVSNGGSSGRLIIQVDRAGRLTANVRGSSINITSSALTTNTFYHLVVTTSGSNYVFHLNNSNLGNISAGTFNETSNIISIGTRFDSFFLKMDGRVDEVGVWNKELTTTEISALYNDGAGLSYPFSPNAQPAFLLNFL